MLLPAGRSEAESNGESRQTNCDIKHFCSNRLILEQDRHMVESLLLQSLTQAWIPLKKLCSVFLGFSHPNSIFITVLLTSDGYPLLVGVVLLATVSYKRSLINH